MELQRAIYQKLVEWKERSRGRTALLIEGARRVGKSTIAEKFGRENYRSFVIIDFAVASQAIRDNFSDNLTNLDRFFQTVSLEYGTRLFPRESLIVFDEVQRFPRAREAVKYLVADGRYDILETGSLISIRENVENIVIPSEEEHIKMYPLTFPEFMVAAGEEPLVDYIRECFGSRTPLEEAFHKRASSLVREYMLVGGMPQSVVAYFEGGRDFFQADREKRRILDLYRDDIKKAAKRYKSKVSALFEFIPGYLSTHGKKVTLSKVDENGAFARYDDPIFWLGDSMICNLCYGCNDPNVGFALTRNDAQVKCYLADTGLLVSLAFSENELSSMELYRQIMNGRLGLNEGMLHENLIAQTFASAGRGLYFYTHYSEQRHRNDIEIDFLLSNESKTSMKVYPVEVKSSKNYSAVSYGAFKKRFGKRIGESYIVHPKPLFSDGDGLRVPTYMAFCLVEQRE